MPRLRREERRPALAAFAFLAALLASHTVLETARDAAFLARIPATRLPWMYVGVAAVSLVVARIDRHVARAVSPRAALVVWSMIASLGTAALSSIVPRSSGGSGAALYVLYLWSGVIAAAILVRFWNLLAATFAITQAKRIYPLVGAGSVVGALAGSALASALAGSLSPDRLVLVAGVGFALAAIVAIVLPLDPAPEAPSTSQPPALEQSLASAAMLARHPYARRVGVFVLLSAVTFTLADFAWKQTLAAEVPADDLMRWLGVVALVTNLVSLVSQLALAPWLLRRFDVAVALALLPALLAVASTGLAVGFGLGAALCLRGSDGSLRHSVHRTATELLYVPLAEAVRERVRVVVDVVGQRGGQTIAALVLLGVGARDPSIGRAALVASAAITAALAVRLRRHYLSLLHESVREGASLRAAAYPELDLASLETLLAALDSTDDAEVNAALDVFERDGKTKLVPALLLRHSSEEVVVRALAIFSREGRASARAAIDGLVEHPSVRVRCAAVAALGAIDPASDLLRTRLGAERSPEVRASIVVQLAAADRLPSDEARQRIDEIVSTGEASTRVALAEALASPGAEHLDAPLVALASAAEPEVRIAAVTTMAARPRSAHARALVDAQGDARTRGSARAALASLGDVGFDAVRAALGDTSLAAPVRWELPATLAHLDGARAAAALLERLGVEEDGMARYRILRSLEAAVASAPDAVLDRKLLDAAVTRTVRQAFERMADRLALLRAAEHEPSRRTPGHELLVDLLADKESAARDRLLRLLGLLYPAADFDAVRRSLVSPSVKTRASAIEIVDGTLRPPLRGVVVALIDDRPDAERLAAGNAFHGDRPVAYDDLLAALLATPSEAVQDVVAFHVAELGLRALRPRVERIASTSPVRPDVRRALDVLAREADPC